MISDPKAYMQNGCLSDNKATTSPWDDARSPGSCASVAVPCGWSWAAGGAEQVLARTGGLGRSMGPCKKYWFSCFLTRAPGPREAPRKVPLGYPWAFRGPPGASRRPPGPKTNQSKKHRNLKEVTEQWSPIAPEWLWHGRVPVCTRPCQHLSPHDRVLVPSRLAQNIS
jgi:hypothetical protein